MAVIEKHIPVELCHQGAAQQYSEITSSREKPAQRDQKYVGSLYIPQKGEKSRRNSRSANRRLSEDVRSLPVSVLVGFRLHPGSSAGRQRQFSGVAIQ